VSVEIFLGEADKVFFLQIIRLEMKNIYITYLVL